MSLPTLTFTRDESLCVFLDDLKDCHVLLHLRSGHVVKRGIIGPSGHSEDMQEEPPPAPSVEVISLDAEKCWQVIPLSDIKSIKVL